MPPCGAGERRCYFLLAQKVTKDAPGAAFDERLRTAGAHRRLAPWTPSYGRRPPGNWHLRPAGKIRTDASFCLGPLGPTNWKFERCAVVRTPPTLAEPGRLGGCRGRILSAPTIRVRWENRGRMGTSAPTGAFGSARRGRCPHRPAGHRPGSSLAVGAAISRPTSAAPNRKGCTRRCTLGRRRFTC